MNKHLLIVDIEATCWEPAEFRSPKDPSKHSEIIQIGMCRPDLFRIPSIVVKPEHSEVSEFCTRLTGLTEAAVAQGTTLRDACARIELLLVDAWASYGDYDRVMFKHECIAKGVRYPWPEKHYNIKRLVEYLTGRRMGMAAALQHFGIPMEGRHHDGGDDAYNIARLLRHIRSCSPERIDGEFVGLV